ncbi:hypothetical protein KCP76_17565 [Salmonella enterica subsp. enterica serovar Weltevreden]|nr:hypothetical protein KCP76_17565 [Salmonella enterica subsp. enterica serovar Weltevreden]
MSEAWARLPNFGRRLLMKIRWSGALRSYLLSPRGLTLIPAHGHAKIHLPELCYRARLSKIKPRFGMTPTR